MRASMAWVPASRVPQRRHGSPPRPDNQQLELEGALIAGAGAVVADRGPVGVDRRQQDAPDLRVETAVIARGELGRRLGWIDTRGEERLVGIDVSHARQVLLV